MEAQILEAIGIDFIDESEVLTPADETHHINKHNFKVPVLCGCRDLGEALRRIAEARTPARARAAPPPPHLALPPGPPPRPPRRRARSRSCPAEARTRHDLG